MDRTKSNALRVLVVDDERNIAESLREILAIAGHEVRCASSGEEAMVVLPGFQPQMLIADMIMGGMDGVELARVTAEVVPDCAILLVSGQADTAEVCGRLKESGQRFCIHAKPVPPQILLDVLRNEALRRGAVAEPVKFGPTADPAARTAQRKTL